MVGSGRVSKFNPCNAPPVMMRTLEPCGIELATGLSGASYSDAGRRLPRHRRPRAVVAQPKTQSLFWLTQFC